MTRIKAVSRALLECLRNPPSDPCPRSTCPPSSRDRCGDSECGVCWLPPHPQGPPRIRCAGCLAVPPRRASPADGLSWRGGPGHAPAPSSPAHSPASSPRYPLSVFRLGPGNASPPPPRSRPSFPRLRTPSLPTSTSLRGVARPVSRGEARPVSRARGACVSVGPPLSLELKALQTRRPAARRPLRAIVGRDRRAILRVRRRPSPSTAPGTDAGFEFPSRGNHMKLFQESVT